jgi:hypothetical protein
MSERISGASSSPVDSMRLMLLGGLILQVISLVVAVLAVPGLTDGGGLEGGDRVVMLIALLGFGLGSVLSLTAVIAYGVLLGMRAHDRGK